MSMPDSFAPPDQSPAVVGRRAVWGWACFDFANSPFTTLIVTFVYSTFFASVIAPENGGVLWARAVAVSALLVALLAPVLGAVADRAGRRKPLLFFFTLVCIGSTCLLYFSQPGDTLRTLVLFVLANVAFEMGHVFYNAFLPDVATSRNMGRVSGFGWALGYLGGLLALILCYVGLVVPDEPWFGIGKEGHQNIRSITIVVAIWFAVFSVPTFLWVPDRRALGGSSSGETRAGDLFRRLVRTFGEIRKHRDIFCLLLARLFYNDGLMTIFVLGGIYAQETFGFDRGEIFQFGIVLNVAAGVGAFAMGFLDDRFGGKRLIQVSVVVLVVASLVAVVGESKAALWVAGVLVGLFAGPNQSASRSLMARLVPPDRKNEFFGFFAFSGKATNFLGPALFAWLSVQFDSQRVGLSVVVAFFVLGFILLTRVRDPRE
jgi:UMF1 family MFS transporter